MKITIELPDSIHPHDATPERIVACLKFCDLMSQTFIRENEALGDPSQDTVTISGDKAGRLSWRPLDVRRMK